MFPEMGLNEKRERETHTHRDIEEGIKQRSGHYFPLAKVSFSQKKTSWQMFPMML